MVIKKKIVVLVSVCVIISFSIIAGIFLGSFYINRLQEADNHYTAPVDKTMVLRLEPYSFYTIQLGIFPEKEQVFDITKKLTEIGLYPYITKTSPYKVWLGCFSEMKNGEELVKHLTNEKFEAFIGEGIINDRSLKFPSKNSFMKEKISPLLGKYNLVISHSLKMFKGPSFGEYKLSLWESMISKIKKEINDAVKETDKILSSEEATIYEQNIRKIKEKMMDYSKAISEIQVSKTDKKVLYSQQSLLELIASYHNLISSINLELGTN